MEKDHHQNGHSFHIDGILFSHDNVEFLICVEIVSQSTLPIVYAFLKTQLFVVMQTAT